MHAPYCAPRRKSNVVMPEDADPGMHAAPALRAWSSVMSAMPTPHLKGAPAPSALAAADSFSYSAMAMPMPSAILRSMASSIFRRPASHSVTPLPDEGAGSALMGGNWAALLDNLATRVGVDEALSAASFAVTGKRLPSQVVASQLLMKAKLAGAGEASVHGGPMHGAPRLASRSGMEPTHSAQGGSHAEFAASGPSLLWAPAGRQDADDAASAHADPQAEHAGQHSRRLSALSVAASAPSVSVAFLLGAGTQAAASARPRTGGARRSSFAAGGSVSMARRWKSLTTGGGPPGAPGGMENTAAAESPAASAGVLGAAAEDGSAPPQGHAHATAAWAVPVAAAPQSSSGEHHPSRLRIASSDPMSRPPAVAGARSHQAGTTEDGAGADKRSGMRSDDLPPLSVPQLVEQLGSVAAERPPPDRVFAAREELRSRLQHLVSAAVSGAGHGSGSVAEEVPLDDMDGTDAAPHFASLSGFTPSHRRLLTPSRTGSMSAGAGAGAGRASRSARSASGSAISHSQEGLMYPQTSRARAASALWPAAAGDASALLQAPLAASPSRRLAAGVPLATAESATARPLSSGGGAASPRAAAGLHDGAGVGSTGSPLGADAGADIPGVLPPSGSVGGCDSAHPAGAAGEREASSTMPKPGGSKDTVHVQAEHGVRAPGPVAEGMENRAAASRHAAFGDASALSAATAAAAASSGAVPSYSLAQAWFVAAVHAVLAFTAVMDALLVQLRAALAELAAMQALLDAMARAQRMRLPFDEQQRLLASAQAASAARQDVWEAGTAMSAMAAVQDALVPLMHLSRRLQAATAASAGMQGPPSIAASPSMAAAHKAARVATLKSTLAGAIGCVGWTLQTADAVLMRAARLPSILVPLLRCGIFMLHASLCTA